MPMNGTYHYWMNGRQVDITETFRFFLNERSDSVIEAEHIAPAFDSRIASQAFYKNERISHFEIEWQNNNVNAVKYASAHYQFTSDTIIVDRNIDEQAFRETLPMPEVFVVLPLLQVFIGKAVHETLELGHGNRIPVLTPITRDPNDKVQLLALELDMRSVNHIGHEVIIVNNENFSADIFNFTSNSKVWIAENDILLKHEWEEHPNQLWEAKLVNYNS